MQSAETVLGVISEHGRRGLPLVRIYRQLYNRDLFLYAYGRISRDGGATFGAPQEVLAAPAVTPGTVEGTVVAEGYTLCNTVPAGVGIVPPGKPHAGRIIVGWIAAWPCREALRARAPSQSS